MSAPSPRFWVTPFKYLRWASRERPAYFWSLAIGLVGPISLPIVPRIRNYFGDYNAPQIPVTYPVPTGPRKQLKGFDDEEESSS